MSQPSVFVLSHDGDLGVAIVEGTPNGVRRTMGIKNQDYPRSDLAQWLIPPFMAVQLVSREFPLAIEANFPIPMGVRTMIRRMYRWHDMEGPAIEAPRSASAPVLAIPTDQSRIALLYSGGCDSLDNLRVLSEQYGPENVLCVWIDGINKGHEFLEQRFIPLQKQKIGMPLSVVRLRNGSLTGGRKTMRARNMLLAALATPLAAEFGAGAIVTEVQTDAESHRPYSSVPKHMLAFNREMARVGIDIPVTWPKNSTLDRVRTLIEQRPKWLEVMCNCFAEMQFHGQYRAINEKRYATLPLFDSQCGSCIKCRKVTLARILYDPKLRRADSAESQEDVCAFLKQTVVWRRGKRGHAAEMVGGSFLLYLNEALSQYGMPEVK